MFEYLVRQDKESKEIIFNPKYKDVFRKYEKLNPKEDDENFLNQNNGSQSNSYQQTIRSPNSLNGIQFTNKFNQNSAMDKQMIFGDINQMEQDYHRFQQYEQDDDEENSKERLEEDNTGNLSPIENNHFHDEINEFGDLIKKDKELVQEDTDKKEKPKEAFDEFGSPRIQISLEVDDGQRDSEDVEEHNMKAYQQLKNGQKNDEKKKQQQEFEKKLAKKKEETIGTFKGFGQESIQGQKAPSSSNYSQDCGLLFERISNSSGILEEADLAKDMGIFSHSFNMEINAGNKTSSNRKKSPDLFSPNHIRPRTTSLDDHDLDLLTVKPTAKAGFTGIFANKQQDKQAQKNNLMGIFGGNKQPLPNKGINAFVFNNNALKQGGVFGDSLIERRKNKMSSSNDNEKSSQGQSQNSIIKSQGSSGKLSADNKRKPNVSAIDDIRNIIEGNTRFMKRGKRRSGSSSPVLPGTEKLELIKDGKSSDKSNGSKNNTEEESPIQKLGEKRAIDAHTGVIKDPPHSQDTWLLNKQGPKDQIIQPELNGSLNKRQKTDEEEKI